MKLCNFLPSVIFQSLGVWKRLDRVFERPLTGASLSWTMLDEFKVCNCFLNVRQGVYWFLLCYLCKDGLSFQKWHKESRSKEKIDASGNAWPHPRPQPAQASNAWSHVSLSNFPVIWANAFQFSFQLCKCIGFPLPEIRSNIKSVDQDMIFYPWLLVQYLANA